MRAGQLLALTEKTHRYNPVKTPSKVSKNDDLADQPPGSNRVVGGFATSCSGTGLPAGWLIEAMAMNEAKQKSHTNQKVITQGASLTSEIKTLPSPREPTVLADWTMIFTA